METRTYNVYTFEELSPEGQQNAIERYYDINVDYGWWQYTYDDAADIGLKITEFDLDRADYCKGRFTLYPLEICKAIFSNHGKEDDTYLAAKNYLHDRELLSKQEVTRLCQVEADQLCECFNYVHGVLDVEQDYFDEDVFEDINNEFHRELLECYKRMLHREYEYITSEEAIIEAFEVNEYLFTEDGHID